MTGIDQARYAEFSRRIHGGVSPSARLPISGTIEVTRRCNLACVHCYNNLPAGDREARAAELSLDEHRRILDELAAAGTLWLLYTGGEIFTRADFPDIHRHAKRKGFLVTLFTNGVAVDEARADFLAEWRPFAVEITLYGSSRDTYERVTGVPGSYARARRAIELLLDRGVPLNLKAVVIKENRHELDAMRGLAADLGVAFKLDAIINPRLDGSLAPLATRLDPVEVVALDARDHTRLEAWGQFCDHFFGPAQPSGREDRLYHCGGAVNSFAISPYGELTLCGFCQRDSFDLRAGSFEEGWTRFLAQVLETRSRTVTKCTRCHLKSLCGMCPAFGELENGDPERPVEFLCHVGHLRAHVLGLAVPPHGPCEFCPGGSRHDEILAELADLRSDDPPEG
jgi:radical SAM protein with 4Fe4S-binding SPASM domain